MRRVQFVVPVQTAAHSAGSFSQVCAASVTAPRPRTPPGPPDPYSAKHSEPVRSQYLLNRYTRLQGSGTAAECTEPHIALLSIWQTGLSDKELDSCHLHPSESLTESCRVLRDSPEAESRGSILYLRQRYPRHEQQLEPIPGLVFIMDSSTLKA